jgi:predicted O-linked N-acetylglucosamine transferase (SPINDLY family)
MFAKLSHRGSTAAPIVLPGCQAMTFLRHGTVWSQIARGREDAHEPRPTRCCRRTRPHVGPSGNVGDRQVCGRGRSLRSPPAHHQASRLADAEACYQQALAAEPSHADALYLLGAIALQRGRHDQAVDLIRQAIRRDPNNPAYLCNFGFALRDQGMLDEAVAACRQAIRLAPDFAEAHTNLGLALRDQGKLEEAIAEYREAIRLKPGLAEPHSNLGGVFNQQGFPDEAVAACREAIRLRPDFAEAHSNLGAALYQQGLLEEAARACREAIRLKGDLADAHSNLGAVLREQGKLDEAIEACRVAIEHRKFSADAHHNLGNALYDLGRLDETVAAYRKAIQFKPDFTAAHTSWLTCLNYGEREPKLVIFDAHRDWNERHAKALPRPAGYDNDRTAARRLKVGYLSADFRRHSVAYFLEPLIAHHDRAAVEVFCYAEVAQPDAVTERFKALADHWTTTTGMSDEALAEQIRRDGIDILLDLGGHTAKSRLLVFARKPAPIQATWLGYPNTTGLDTMDYRLVDTVTDPEGEADGFATETLVRLPGGFLCYGGPQDAPALGRPPCFANGIATFGSFNNPAKLSSATLDAWGKLFARLPRARLLLKGRPFAYPVTRAWYLERLAQHGIAADRVELLPWAADGTAHLSLYNRVDIALDPFPYNGTTTTCEALWMGVPVVTLRGDRPAGRVGASLLGQVGYADMVAGSVDKYVDIAMTLADDPAQLADLRHVLRPRIQRSPLCDGAAFARKLESAYRTMWQRWCDPPPAKVEPARASLLQRWFGASRPAGAREGNRDNDAIAGRPRFLLIKSWGCGFWSDAANVLGCLLLAEITGRSPVVHWGENSRFGGRAGGEAFRRYFAPVNGLTIDRLLAASDADFFPPKWRRDNLTAENVAVWDGEYSRTAAFDFLRRPETIAVCDYYIGVVDVMPWIPATHAMHGKSLRQICCYLIDKYLHPSPAILSHVEAFHRQHLAGSPFVAVHMRGSDKGGEDPGAEAANEACLAALGEIDPTWRILLLTDDERWFARVTDAFGARVVNTGSQRTATTTGLHYEPAADGVRLGTEIMVDTYLALYADRFIGNGRSNVAAIIAELKEWPPGACTLVRPSLLATSSAILAALAQPLRDDGGVSRKLYRLTASGLQQLRETGAPPGG